jgi:hypothetical protein
MSTKLEATIAKVNTWFDETANHVRQELDLAIAQARAEEEALSAPTRITEAVDFVVRDIEVASFTVREPVRFTSMLMGMNGCTREGGQQTPLGEVQLAPGKYRAIVLFFKREG